MTKRRKRFIKRFMGMGMSRNAAEAFTQIYRLWLTHDPAAVEAYNSRIEQKRRWRRK